MLDAFLCSFSYLVANGNPKFSFSENQRTVQDPFLMEKIKEIKLAEVLV